MESTNVSTLCFCFLFMIAVLTGCKENANVVGTIAELEASVSYVKEPGPLLPADSLTVSIVLPRDPINLRTGSPFDLSSLELFYRFHIWKFDPNEFEEKSIGPTGDNYQLDLIHGGHTREFRTSVFRPAITDRGHEVEFVLYPPNSPGTYLLWWDISLGFLSFPHPNDSEDLILINLINDEGDDAVRTFDEQFPGLLDDHGINENHGLTWFNF